MNVSSDQLQLVRKLSWEDVFQIWEEQEATNPKWVALYTERGFKSWRQWRESYAGPLKLGERNWALYEVREAKSVVPKWYGGPFRTWIQKYYHGKRIAQFADLARIPDVQAHPGVQELLKTFPQKTTLIGLMKDGDVVILEGMHRCCAIAIATTQEKPIAGKVFIALADDSGEELPVVGQAINE